MRFFNLKYRPVILKIVLTLAVQLVFYFLLFIMPSNSEIEFIMPLNALFIPIFDAFFLFGILIISVFSVTFLVDQIRYWLIGTPVLYGLAWFYTNPQALFHITKSDGFIGINMGGFFLFILIFYLFFALCVLCILKRIIIEIVKK